jgi:hypothetical protein
MAVLTIDWKTMEKLPALEAPVLTGISEEEEEAAAEKPQAPVAAERPYLIWVNDETTAEGFDQVGKVILADDKVAIGSHAFLCVKMTAAQATEDPVLKEKGGKEVPRIVLVSADHKTVTALEKGRLSVGGVYDAMKATANKFYKNDFDKAVRDLRGVLTEYDKINGERSVLDDKEKRVKEKGNPAEEKKLAADRADLDKRQAAAEEKHKKIWDLKPKAAAA